MADKNMKNSEANFVVGSVFEFIKAWESGSTSRLQLESKNGKAWINFSCELGSPGELHVKKDCRKNYSGLYPNSSTPASKSQTKSSKRKERDIARAKNYQESFNNTREPPPEQSFVLPQPPVLESSSIISDSNLINAVKYNSTNTSDSDLSKASINDPWRVFMSSGVNLDA